VTSEQVEQESSRPQFSLRAILIFLSAASVLLAVGRATQVPGGALFVGSALCVAAIGFIAGLVVRARVFSGTFALMMLASGAVFLVEAMRTPQPWNRWSLPASLFVGWIGASIYLLRPRSFRTVIQLAYGLTWAPLFISLILVLLPPADRFDADFFLVLVFIPLPAIVALLPFWSFGKSSFKSEGQPPTGMPRWIKPPRTVLHDRLWVGSARDLADVSGVLLLGVQAVVDLAANEAPVQYPRDIAYCRLPLVDGAENDEAILRLAVVTTAEFIRSGTPTLVACSAGMSRSLAIAAAGLALARGLPADQALIKVAAESPHDVSGALWADIKRVARLDPQDNSQDA
jgi:protein-tyrosine phosphatase